MVTVNIGVRVPVSLEVEVRSGQSVHSAVEDFVHSRFRDVDGEITIYSVDSDDISDLDADDTVYICDNCGEAATESLDDDGCCDDCHEEPEEAPTPVATITAPEVHTDVAVPEAKVDNFLSNFTICADANWSSK